MTISKETFRRSMTLFPGAVTLITAGQGADRRGITATAVCSVSDAPPSILVCVNAKTDTRAEILQTGAFSVQLLSADAHEMALHFAGATGAKGVAKFALGDWDAWSDGPPRLGGALASLSCTVAHHSDAGSHTVFIGHIKDACLGDGDALVYARAAFHRLARVG